jgi:CO dehydrogenase maturation factor
MTPTTARPVALRVGVVGKGGVGKTTVAGLLARAWAERGRTVVAIDTDSNPNLGLSLGLSLEETEAVPVLPRSVVVGRAGGPAAEELVEEYGRPTPAGPMLLSAIKVAQAGAGCTCGGHATVRSLLADALADVDLTLVDMEAGLEHLSRSGGTLAHADLLLVVCEPTRKSVITAVRTATLAAELGIPKVLAVGNKSRSPEDEAYLHTALAEEGLAVAGVLPYDEDVASADRAGAVGIPPGSPAVRSALDTVLDAVESSRGSLAADG